MKLVSAAQHADCDIVWLDVTVGDALVFKVVKNVEQVFTEPLQQVHMKPAVLAEPLAQGLDDLPVLVGENGSQQERGSVADLLEFDEAHDALMAQILLGEHLGLILDSRIMLRIIRRLENEMVIVLRDEQSHRASALSQTSDNAITTGQEVPDLRLGWVGDIVVIGRSQLRFDFVELPEEFDCRVSAIGNLGMGAELDQVLQGLPGAVQNGADLQALRLSQAIAQLQGVSRGGHSREDVIRDCSQGEDVEMLSRVVIGEGLRSHVCRARVLDKPVDMRGGFHHL